MTHSPSPPGGFGVPIRASATIGAPPCTLAAVLSLLGPTFLHPARTRPNTNAWETLITIPVIRGASGAKGGICTSELLKCRSLAALGMTTELFCGVVCSTHALGVLALELVEDFVGEQLVGDPVDLFGLAPRFSERCQLAFEGAALDVFVRCHLERKTIHRRQAKERRRLLRAGAAASPEGTVRELQRDAFGEAVAGGLDQSFVGCVGDAAPLRSHCKGRDTREVAFAIAGFVELRDGVLHLGIARDAKVQRREHLPRCAQSNALGEAREAAVMAHDQSPRCVAIGTNQLGAAEMRITNDDRQSAVIDGAREHGVTTAEDAEAQHRLVAETDGRRVARERRGRASG